MGTTHRLGILAVAATIALCAADLPAASTSADPSPLRGDPFTDPRVQASMPQGWDAKPLVSEDWAKDADVVVVMDQDIFHTTLPFIEDYQRKTGLKIVAREGTCGIAAGMLARKSIDMGGFCCPAGKEDRFPGIRYHTLGIVGKAFFVHPDNPVDNLTREELRNIYRGNIHRWSEVRTGKGNPGPDRTIKAVGRLHCMERPGHWRLLLDGDKLFSPRLFEVGSIPDMITRVATAPNAIGWEVLSMVDRYKDRGRVKVLSIDGFRPNDPEALATLKYPFYRTYTITTWERKGMANKNAQALAQYLIAETETLNAERYGFVPASRLRKAGWKFLNDEVIGEPR